MGKNKENGNLANKKIGIWPHQGCRMIKWCNFFWRRGVAKPLKHQLIFSWSEVMQKTTGTLVNSREDECSSQNKTGFITDWAKKCYSSRWVSCRLSLIHASHTLQQDFCMGPALMTPQLAAGQCVMEGVNWKVMSFKVELFKKLQIPAAIGPFGALV